MPGNQRAPWPVPFSASTKATALTRKVEAVAALAIDEGAKHRPEAIAMRAERSGNGFSLSGRKQFVVQGASADVILVAANSDEGMALFAVEKDAKGLDVEGVRLADASIGA